MQAKQRWMASGWVLVIVAAAAEVVAATLTGTVVDASGAPIAGARVDIASAGPKIGAGIFCPTCYVDCAKSTKTDDAGKFEIRALSDALKFRVLCSAEGRQTHITELIDPAVRPLAVTLAESPRDVPAERTIRGVVVDEQGVPIEGALVSPGGAKMGSRRWWGRVEGVTPVVSDSAGRFGMFVPEGMTAADLSVEADGLAGTTTELSPAGGDEQRIVVPAGARVTGVLADADGPRTGAQVAVVQMNREAGSHFIAAVAATTDDAGRFEMTALPAAQEYAIFSPVGQGAGDGWVVATRRFRVGDSGSTRDVGTLNAERGLTLAGRLAAPAGAELPRGVKLSLGRDPAWDLIEIPVDDEGRFELAGLPAETYTIRVTAPGWELATEQLTYQGLDEASFGVLLNSSLDDLTIPLRPVAGAAETPTNDIDPRAAAASPGESPTPAATATALTAADGGAVPVIRTREPAPADGPQLNLAGHVVDASGAPVPDATVVLRAKLGGQQYILSLPTNHDVLARTTTNRAGRFLLPNIAIPPRLEETIASLQIGDAAVELLVAAKGFGLSWTEIASLDAFADMRVTLEPEAEVRGAVRDAEGQPVAGAEVFAWGITKAQSTPDDFLNAPGELNLTRSEFTLQTVSDAEGRFVMNGLPRNRRALVGVRAPGFKQQSGYVDTTPGDTSGRVGSVENRRNEPATPIYRSPFEMALDPAPQLRVRVVDSDGKPVDGGGIMLIDAERHYGGEAAVGADGVAVASLRSTGKFQVYYDADPLDARLGGAASVDVPADIPAAGAEPTAVEIRLPQERWLTGRVVDADTGAGVVGVHVNYAASETPAGAPRPPSSIALSGADGQFRLPVVAGAGTLSIGMGVNGYLAPTPSNQADNSPEFAGVEVDVPAAGDAAPVELKLARGLVIRGFVKTADGAPVVGAAVLATHSGRPFRSAATKTDNNGAFTLSGLSPHAETLVAVVGSRVGVWHTIDGDGAHPWDATRNVELDITAEPGVTLAGRVLKNGQPASGVRMILSRSLPGQLNRTLVFAQLATGADGKYSASGLAAGDRYSFEIRAADGATDPAWTHQSPYIQTVDGQPGDVVDLPDVNLVSAGQTLAGIVVDPTGRPVPKATVSTMLRNGQSVPRPANGPPPWMQTDAEGRFELASLPDAPLQLMAYIANPAGGRIHFPARVQPRRNQADIRIVLDPRLSADAPELEPTE